MPYNQIVTCLVLRKKTLKNNITPMTGHCGIICVAEVAQEREQILLGCNTSSCSNAENNFVKATLKNNYAFGNIAVKFCEIFTCPGKQNAI
jgi:hypothetical protein